MVRVSITLPNNTKITVESEDAEVLHEIVGLALRDLPRDLMQSSYDSAPPSNGTAEKDTSVTTSPPAAVPDGGAVVAVDEAPPATAAHEAAAPQAAGPAASRVAPDSGNRGSTTSGLQPESISGASRMEFFEFCRDASPMGDMRRVVVAAEGAIRYFGTEGVSAEDLGRLFDLAGWRKPNNFTQTAAQCRPGQIRLAGAHSRPLRPLRGNRPGPVGGRERVGSTQWPNRAYFMSSAPYVNDIRPRTEHRA